MLEAEPRFVNPLLSPEFCDAVAAVRADAYVAVGRRRGRPVAFLAHHRHPGGLARPIGSPFSDYHAVITEPESQIGAAELLRAAGLRTFRYAGLIDPWSVLDGVVEEQPAFRVVLDGSGDGARRTRTATKQARRLEKEYGPLVFRAGDPSPSHLQHVLGWKSGQLVATGLHDVFSPDWVRALMGDLHGRQGEGFGGLLTTLEVGGRLVAGSFGVRRGDSYHAWVISHDPAFSAYSPGSVLQMHNVAAMPGLGLRVWDLGCGDYDHKRRIATAVDRVRMGVAAVGSSSAWDRAAVSTAARPVARLARRLDHIAAAEPTWAGRLRGTMALAMATPKRLRAARALAV